MITVEKFLDKIGNRDKNIEIRKNKGTKNFIIECWFKGDWHQARGITINNALKILMHKMGI